MIRFTVDGDNVALDMLTKCDVSEGVATEILGLMQVINGVKMFSYGATPVWDVTVDDDSLEVHAQVNRADININRRW